MAESTIKRTYDDWHLVAEVTQQENTSLDETIALTPVLANKKEVLFTCQRVSNGRVFASAVCAYHQYINGAIYAYGSWALNGSNPRAAVAIFADNGNKVEIAAETTTEAIKYRLFYK